MGPGSLVSLAHLPPEAGHLARVTPRGVLCHRASNVLVQVLLCVLWHPFAVLVRIHVQVSIWNKYFELLNHWPFQDLHGDC